MGIYNTGFENALDLVTNAIDNIMAGNLNIEDLLITKTIGREITKYNALFPHVSAALQLKNKGMTLNKGDNVDFIFTASKHRNPVLRVKAITSGSEPAQNIATEYDRDKYLQLLLDAAETVQLQSRVIWSIFKTN